MFKLLFTTESQPRTSSGQPAHNTTGVASANSSHRECAPKYIRTSKGAVSAALSQSLRRMSIYSGFTSSTFATVKVAGSNAMPHLGHEPGPIWRTSGCIGQVYSTPAAVISAFIGSGGAAGCRYFSGFVSNLATQPFEQK